MDNPNIDRMVARAQFAAYCRTARNALLDATIVIDYHDLSLAEWSAVNQAVELLQPLMPPNRWVPTTQPHFEFDPAGDGGVA